MKETTDTLNGPSYYPSTKDMTTQQTSENSLSYNESNPTMELTFCHDQWRKTSVVSNTSQQQEHLPSVRCTLCKDQSDQILFYRPSMALHTLFETPELDGPSVARYNKKQRYTLDSPAHLSTNETTSGQSMETNDQDPHHRLVIPKLRQSYATLYNATNDQALWTFTEQDWHTMTLVSRQPPHPSILMTTSTFSFVWENGLFQWRMQLDEDSTALELVCDQWESNHTKRRIAWLRKDATRLTLYSKSNKVDGLDTFLVLSGLLLHELIRSQVRTLGGGRDVMTMMIERQSLALVKETALFYQLDGIDEEDLGGRDPSRWSSSSSMKSLELDQAWWQCWWTWIPCCMPGSWCDRAWIKARGIKRYHHRSRVTRRMQGWQQQA